MYRISPLATWLRIQDALQVACEVAMSFPEDARAIATAVYMGAKEVGDRATARQASALLAAL